MPAIQKRPLYEKRKRTRLDLASALASTVESKPTTILDHFSVSRIPTGLFSATSCTSYVKPKASIDAKASASAKASGSGSGSNGAKASGSGRGRGSGSNGAKAHLASKASATASASTNAVKASASASGSGTNSAKASGSGSGSGSGSVASKAKANAFEESRKRVKLAKDHFIEVVRVAEHINALSNATLAVGCSANKMAHAEDMVTNLTNQLAIWQDRRAKLAKEFPERNQTAHQHSKALQTLLQRLCSNADKEKETNANSAKFLPPTWHVTSHWSRAGPCDPQAHWMSFCRDLQITHQRIIDNVESQFPDFRTDGVRFVETTNGLSGVFGRTVLQQTISPETGRDVLAQYDKDIQKYQSDLALSYALIQAFTRSNEYVLPVLPVLFNQSSYEEKRLGNVHVYMKSFRQEGGTRNVGDKWVESTTVIINFRADYVHEDAKEPNQLTIYVQKDIPSEYTLENPHELCKWVKSEPESGITPKFVLHCNPESTLMACAAIRSALSMIPPVPLAFVDSPPNMIQPTVYNRDIISAISSLFVAAGIPSIVAIENPVKRTEERARYTCVPGDVRVVLYEWASATDARLYSVLCHLVASFLE